MIRRLLAVAALAGGTALALGAPAHAENHATGDYHPTGENHATGDYHPTGENHATGGSSGGLAEGITWL